MRVVLHDEVFASEAHRLELLHIIAFGYQERHQILTEPLYQPGGEEQSGSCLGEWISRLPEGLREEVEFTLEVGVEDLDESKSKDEIDVIDAKASNWGSSPPKLTVEDARRLLDRSLHLLIENARNDRKFLEAMCKRLLGTEYWEPIQKAVDEKWLHYEHGGGIGSMKNAVEQLANDHISKMRTWVMFDSDAPRPDEPSAQSQALSDVCEEHSIEHHQLRRRTIENYLPQRALEASAELLRGTAKSARRRAAWAFAEMSRAQQHHFRMKKGFAAEINDLPEFYADIPQEDRLALADGFGKDIGELFYRSDQQGWESWLESEFTKREKDEFIEIADTIYRKL